MTKKILSIISVILCIVLICPIYVSANDESVYTSHKTDSGKICFNGFATTNNVSKTISLHLTEMLLAKENYKQADSWLNNTVVSKKLFENLEDLLIKNKLIESYVPFNKLVINLNE